MDKQRGIIAVFLLLLQLVRVAECLNCYQCLNCPNSLRLRAPEPCHSANERACAKIVTSPDTPNEKVIRKCTNTAPKTDQASGCHFDMCMYVCKVDGCNSAPSVFASVSIVIALVFLAAIVNR